MKKCKFITSLVLCAALLLCASAGLVPGFATKAEAANPGKWVASWSTAAVEGTISLQDYVPGVKINDFIPARSVVRTELQLSAGGLYTKLCFSNEYGTSDLKIGAASIAKSDTTKTANILPETATAITFNDGQTSAVIKPGQILWTDSIYFPCNSLEYVSVSVYFPSTTYIKTGGLYGGRSFLNTLANENTVNNKSVNANNEIKITSSTITYHTIPFLTRVDVRSTYADAYSVVFIGDSTLTNEAYHYFAQRAYTAGYSHVGFVNNSIVANRLLYDGVGLIGKLYGEAVVDRFQRDAVDMTGAEVILVKIGLNDILHPMSESMKGSAPYASTDEIIAGYEKIIRMARTNGQKVYFFTNTAWKGYEREFLGQSGDLSWNNAAQAMCNELDAWVRSTKLIDGYFEMSPLSSPVDKDALLPAFTTDGAHLTELGAVAMADLIDPIIIGAGSLPTAADINGVNPYASVQDVINQYNASLTTTQNNAANNGNTNKPGNTTRPNGNQNNPGNVDIDASIAASVLASRQEAANNAGNAGSPAVSTTKNSNTTTTTKKNNSNSNTTTTQKNTANNTTTTTKATGGSSTTTTTTPAGTTAPTAKPVEPAGDTSSTAGNVVYNDTTAASEQFSISITLGNGYAEADEMGAAQQPVIAEEFSNNGSTIGIILVVVMVGMIALAVVITVKSKRRSDME